MTARGSNNRRQPDESYEMVSLLSVLVSLLKPATA
jgi:hypothetical protein